MTYAILLFAVCLWLLVASTRVEPGAALVSVRVSSNRRLRRR
jgi:hypothetical protein